MNKRKFIKTFLYGVLCLIFPFRISAVEKKIINPNLTEEQKNIMFKEGTERAGTSILNYEKEKAHIIVQIVMQNYLTLLLNSIAAQAGHRSRKLCQELLKQRLIILLA